MAAGHSQGASHMVLQWLRACLDADQATRSGGEQQLAAASGTPGLCLTLAQIATGAPSAVQAGLEHGLRQLAGVVLKQHIRRHWTPENEAHFKPPQLEASEKEAVKTALSQGLADPDSRLRTAVGVCISEIVTLDPNGWPQLLHTLVQSVKFGDCRSNAGERCHTERGP